MYNLLLFFGLNTLFKNNDEKRFYLKLTRSFGIVVPKQINEQKITFILNQYSLKTRRYTIEQFKQTIRTLITIFNAKKCKCKKMFEPFRTNL